MRAFAAVGVLFIVAACQAPPPEMTEAEASGAEAIQELGPLEQAFGAAMMEGDLEAVMNLFASDAVEIVPGRYRTRTEIVTDYEEGLRTLNFSGWESEPLFAWVHGDVGYMLSRIGYEFSAEGEDPATDELYSFMRLVKEDGEWKIHRSLVGYREAPPAGMTEAEIAQVEAEVMDWAEDLSTAYEQLSRDRLAGYWLQENVSSVSFAERAVGLEEIAAIIQNLMANRASIDQEWLPGSVVDVLSPTMALFQGTMRSSVTTPDGNAFVQRVHHTILLKKVDGSWKIQRSHVSGGVVQEG